ncbi:MAG: DNA ligase D [Sphingomonas sp.]
MAKPGPLDIYNAKRDFTRTREPRGELATAAGNSFMVQKHAATRLHWDFRLELGGVLKSWAVTRGPSADPADKRLAVRTEDHPLSYATFEGTIPAGDYGGGTVMLWDRGTWTPAPGKDPARTIEEGHLHFTLHGQRMKGEWIMVRLKPRAGERRENWLLRKVADDHAGGSDDLVGRALTSIATGRTMEAIAAGKPVTAKPKPGPNRRKAGAKAALPAFRPPQLATLVDAVPTGSGWLHEVKYDGYRTLLAIGGGGAKAYTRTGLDWSDRFAPIVTAIAAAVPGSALVDGEVVALDARGHPSFSALQTALKEGGDLHFFAFDLLSADGEDLTGLPNVDRKARLAALLADAPPPIHYADHVADAGEALFAGLCREGYEGVVSKRADAPYRGARTRGWLKTKCVRRQEFVIVGWLPSEKGRGFRSLLLGLHDGDMLRYAGKVGTGFDQAAFETVLAKLKPLARKTPTLDAPRAMVRDAHWVTPTLVAEVAFAEFTADRLLRHASFVALREDKPAREVIAETPLPVTSAAAGASPVADSYAGIHVSNPDRVIFPETHITKGELAAYYHRLAGPLLRWLADRPVSLVRCPQGRAKHCFFQTHDAGSFGAAVKQVPIPDKDGGTENYLYVTDPAGVIACVQMGGIEFHGWGASVADVEAPDRMVFDLDPDEGLDFDDVRAAAVILKDALAGLGLVSFPMLSGGKGVHVVVPLDPRAQWPAVKDFASRFARAMAAAHPKRFTASMKKTERTGRIFIDWLRNQRGATAILPYAVRARAGAPVAAPITWAELKTVPGPAHDTMADAAALLKRAKSKPLQNWGVARQVLPDA